MRKTILLFLAAGACALAQIPTSKQIRFVTADPSGACTASYITENISTGNQMICKGSVWSTNNSGGGGGTGTVTTSGSPAAHQVAIFSGATAITGVSIGTGGRLLIDQGAGANPSFNAMSQDCTITSGGVVTCTKTNNVNFGTSATVNTGTSGATIPLLNGANTYSGASIFSAAGAASTAGITITGAPYAAGTATTNFPQVYLNGGAGPTSFSTAGTYLGINAASGFTGNVLDAHVNGGASVASINYQGNALLAGTLGVTGHVTVEGVTSTGATGTGKFVFDASPTISGHPTVEGVTSTGATGTGQFVFDTSPTIAGHPTVEGITSTGATGTGKFVFDGSPTLVTAALGSSTATTQSQNDNSTKVSTTAYVDAAKVSQLFSWCNGTVGTANATTYVLVPSNTTGTACTLALASGVSISVTRACTAKNLFVTAGGAGGAAGSGAVTLYKNGVAQALTCTLGTGTTCNDTTHTVAYTSGQVWEVVVTTGQATDTTSNIRAAFECE